MDYLTVAHRFENAEQFDHGLLGGCSEQEVEQKLKDDTPVEVTRAVV